MSARRQRIMLTRSEQDCSAWAIELAQRGAEAIVFPCIDTEIVDTDETRARLRHELRRADWIVFTSKRGVGAFVELMGRELPARAKVATVGAATANAAATALGRADLTGTHGTAAELANELVTVADRNQNMLLVLAENAATALEHKLAAKGHRVSRIAVYRTIPKPALQRKRRFSTFDADWVFLASPSSTVGFANQVELDCDASFVAIGPTTTSAARRQGFLQIREARVPSLSGLMEAIECPTPT
jgi:uroporphyrinogen-III synthase